ncbi:metal-dependent hydrolase [Haloarchaeobius sp. DFWS5]|uniref:metal-dependent hydrolase n=1 Tax=Haloarchaeobius sp. DFWS5 TaxID=3446114 RepID=UPI003EBEF306
MYALGHLGIALLAFAPLALFLRNRRRNHVAAAGTLTTACFATLPDIDQWLATVPHRGVTHTVWFGVALGVVLASGAAVYGRRSATVAVTSAGWAMLVGTLTTIAHLTGDVVTPMGISPLAPVVEGHVTLNLVAAANPAANQTLFTLGMLATVASWWAGTEREQTVPTRRTIRRAVGRVDSGTDHGRRDSP